MFSCIINMERENHNASCHTNVIALDLDDTLLNAKKEVTPETRRATAKRLIGQLTPASKLFSLRAGPLQGMQFVLDQVPGHADYTISSGEERLLQIANGSNPVYYLPSSPARNS